MNLTATPISDWRDLQNQVARILAECGYEVLTEHTVETVRGSVELDVYATHSVDGRVTTTAIECKHWSSRVPQSVVHAFRTVVSDIGINIGYVVSKSGFQSGAIEAANHSNIKLLGWAEFQAEYIDTWLREYLAPSVASELELLTDYTEPLVPNWFLQVPEDQKSLLRDLRERHGDLGRLVMAFTPYVRMLHHTPFPSLPLRQKLHQFSDNIPSDILDAEGYREFLDHLVNYGKQAIEDFDIIKRRNMA